MHLFYFDNKSECLTDLSKSKRKRAASFPAAEARKIRERPMSISNKNENPSGTKHPYVNFILFSRTNLLIQPVVVASKPMIRFSYNGPSE